MKLLRNSGFAIGALLCFLACSGDDTPASSSGGLALTITTDGSVSPDRVTVKVSSDTAVLLESELMIATTPLPWTANVDAKSSDAATVVVQAWSGSTPLDRRDASVTGLPKDRFAPFQVLLSSTCTPHAHAAADGSVTSDCAAGTTCDPANGSCGDDVPGDTKCTTGAARCNGRNIEKCSANAEWLVEQTCAYVCTAGACTGSCVPGQSQCCVTIVDNGQPVKDCDSTRYSSVCIAGTGSGDGMCQTNAGNPSTVFIEHCDADGNPQQIDCAVGKGTLENGTVAEGCGTCPDTNTATCFQFDGSHACIQN